MKSNSGNAGMHIYLEPGEQASDQVMIYRYSQSVSLHLFGDQKMHFQILTNFNQSGEGHFTNSGRQWLRGRETIV